VPTVETPHDSVGECAALQELKGGENDPGLQPALHDVLLQMFITSDNTATDIPIGKVGGVDKVNAWLKQNGYADALKLNMTTGGLFAKYNALPTGANRNEKTNGDRAYWLSAMTPRATGWCSRPFSGAAMGMRRRRRSRRRSRAPT
jgi:beta-lactamase class A